MAESKDQQRAASPDKPGVALGEDHEDDEDHEDHGTEPHMIIERREPPRIPAPGTILGGRYEIQGLLGLGGAGVVCRAWDQFDRRPVAIKTSLVLHGARWQAFEREMLLLSTLRHPAIVRYRDSGRTDHDEPFLVMELLQGETLRNRLLRAANLSLPQTCRFVAKVLHALAFIHARGIVHRDLKPSNIFLSERRLDRPKLLDFGVARDKGPWVRIFADGVVGTRPYMSPEQARGATDVDHRSDIFAAGRILLECAGMPSGRSTSVALLPPTLARLVAPMLAHDRDKRPREAGKLAVAMARLASELEKARPGARSPLARPQHVDWERAESPSPRRNGTLRSPGDP